MFKQLLKKFYNAFLAIVPIILIVSVLYAIQITTKHFDSDFLNTELFIVFLCSSFCLMIGMTLFTLGVDSALGETGKYLGASFAKQKSLILVIVLMTLLGILIAIAEPDVSVLASYIPANEINPLLLKICIGIGCGIFFVLGYIRIMFQKSLKLWYVFFFLIIFGIAALFGDKDGAIIDLSFDSGAVVTGPITVPFFIAFGVGIAGVRGGKNSTSDSFGITAMCSMGPIISVMILGLLLKPSIASPVFSNDISTSALLSAFLNALTSVSIALLPIIAFFLVYNFFVMKLPKNEIFKIMVGYAFSYVGLIIFLTAANYGFIPVGNSIGKGLGKDSSDYGILLLLCILFGLTIVLAEPGVQILSTQVEDISKGVISRKKMLISLAIGVSLAILLSVIRAVYDIKLLYMLVPLYIIVFLLSLIVPDIYTAIAFDAGEVASGLMASSFVLPFVLGVASCFDNDISGFGVIGMIAAMPVITVEVMGLYAEIKTKMQYHKARRRILAPDDLQIIHFDKGGVTDEK
ncbi:MAG: DUF1538 domain-containing protein [Bacilli bacterium]|jgi:hypothetical protein